MTQMNPRFRPPRALLAAATAAALSLGLQGCLAAAAGGMAVGAAGAVVGTAGAVTVGTARVTGHVVATGVRAATGSGRDRQDRRR